MSLYEQRARDFWVRLLRERGETPTAILVDGDGRLTLALVVSPRCRFGSLLEHWTAQP